MDARDLIQALLGLGLNQTVIAERTGMAQPTISKVARGEVKDVMSRNYRRLLELHAEVSRESGGEQAKPGAQPEQEARHAA